MAEATEKPGDPYTLVVEPNDAGELADRGAVDIGGAEEGPQPSMTWMLLRELVETVVLSLVIFLLIRQVVQNYRIESHSMEPNFYEGQFILVNKLAYKLGAPERGDVLVFHNPRNEDEDYIKRVIGLPGDTVQLQDQTVLINGEPVQEPYLQNRIPMGTVFGPVVVEPNHLFVMGDNRPNSEDSRSFGQLSEDLIVGQAWLRVWPVSEFGLVSHMDLDPVVPVSLAPIPATQ
ncbi:MAG: signal peptidase I [Caldilineaceae bacterium]|nr:signal peptidase I [Caldilineaceae bacterium]